MKVNAVKQICETVSKVPKKVKRGALIAAVTLPTMAATQSCCPWLFGPYYCPPPVPVCPMPVAPVPVPVPVPIVTPVPCGPFFYGPCCDKNTTEEVGKELSELG